jgi:hypothetical protein
MLSSYLPTGFELYSPHRVRNAHRDVVLLVPLAAAGVH